MDLSYHIRFDGQGYFLIHRVRIVLEIRKQFLAQRCGYEDVKSCVANTLSRNTAYFRLIGLPCQDKILVFLVDAALRRSTRKRGNDDKVNKEQTILEKR